MQCYQTEGIHIELHVEFIVIALTQWERRSTRIDPKTAFVTQLQHSCRILQITLKSATIG